MPARAMEVACCAFLLGVTAGSAFAEDEEAVESMVTGVTVYPEWAYVTREAEVELEQGPVRFVFKGLPAWIDEESIRASVDGAGDVRIAGVSAKTTYLARSTKAEVRRAEEELRKLSDAMEDLRNELSGVETERAYFSEIKVWQRARVPKEAAERKVSLDELEAVRKFVCGGTLAAVKRATEIRRRIRDLGPELAAKQKELGDLRGRTRLEQKEIAVEIESEADANATLSVSYLISGASWYPAYDARTDRDKKKVDIACRAVVQQTTGEDWSAASFTLSTIQPYLTREKPELKPWYVNASTTQMLDAQAGMQLAAGQLGVAQTSVQRSSSTSPYGSRDWNPARQRMQQIQKGQFAYNIGKGGKSAQAFRALLDNYERARAVIRQVEERGVTVEFDIAGEHSVKADGKPVKMVIGQAELEATLRYSAVPVVSRSTYVTGEMRNAGEFPFLPGEVKVYIDGSFIGKSKVACVAEGEKFELYLGLEERIKVTRKLDAQKSSTSRSGKRKQFVAAYKIEITSFLKTSAVVEIRDQVPVSQDNRVKVKVLGVDPPADETDKGIITWSVYLGARGSRELAFEFRVDYPAGVYVGGAKSIEREIMGM